MDLTIQALILAGGKGTRLRALHPEVPKALVEVHDRPFLEWQLLWLRAAGVVDVHLAAGCMAEQLERWAKSTPVSGVGITLSIEPDPRGTGGAIKYAEPFLKTDPFLVLNGDSILPGLDLAALVGEHRASGSMVTMAVTHVEDGSRFGSVELGEANRITAFEEKKDGKDILINGGVYLLDRKVLALIPDGAGQVSIERDVFPDLVARGTLSGFACPPPLLDMGTPEGLDAMERYLARNPR